MQDSLTTLADLDHPTPAGLAYLNMALGADDPARPGSSTGLLHGLLPRWLASVYPRIRWRFLLACLGRRGGGADRHPARGLGRTRGSAGDVGTKVNAFTSTTRDYLLVIAVLTPFQAAGEEYLFRGYLTQAFGGLFHRAWVAVVVPAFLFGLAHGLGQSIPVFFDRFAFGLVAGALVVLTGGLEAGIAMHVLNNWLAFGLALAYGDMASTLNPSGGSWWSIPVTLTQSLVYLGLAVLVCRRMGLTTTTTARVLEAPPSRV